MAEITSTITQLHPSQPKLNVVPVENITSSQHNADIFSASDDDIPTVDYSLLFSDNPVQRFLALENLRQACQEYGFFYVKSFTIPCILNIYILCMNPFLFQSYYT